ncbi:MAG TPA: FHA domain-containing protein [Arthrobacter sp.]|nr:FHA domain-containing protein [Arthrobacter sp.]
MRLDIDMSFTLAEAGDDQDRRAAGTIRAAGTEVEINIDDPALFQSDKSPLISAAKPLAQALAARGLTLRVAGPQGDIVMMGAVKASAAQRILTGSPHIKLGSWKALAPLAGRFARSSGSASLVPPSTPLPLMPMVHRRIQRKITTTHYTSGGGHPRLYIVRDSPTWDGTLPDELDLSNAETITIGSAPEADLQLDGLEPLHAEIHHTGLDEYVLHAHAPVGGSVDGDRSVLRTGARIVIGQWRIGFFREEYADHGRPFGGRSGGEFARQREQYNPRTGHVEHGEE